MTMTIRVTNTQPRDQFDFLRSAVAFADEVGPKVRDEMRRRAPVGVFSPQPGRLSRSIRYSRTVRAGTVRMEFKAHVPYARYVTGGTGPHLITRRAAMALHWLNASGSHFARTVHHPGTAPNRFPHEALTLSKPLVEVAFRQHMTGGI
jgi:hypothetical protein